MVVALTVAAVIGVGGLAGAERSPQATTPARPTYFVAPTGSDSNNCASKKTACASWNAAYQRARADSVVNVECAAYPPQTILMPQVRRVDRRDVTFEPAHGCNAVTVLGSLDLQGEHITVKNVNVVNSPEQLNMPGPSRARIRIWPTNISGSTPDDITVVNGSANYIDVLSARNVLVKGGIYGNQPNYGSHVGSFSSAIQGAENVTFDGVTFRDVYPDSQLDSDPRATCLSLRNFVGVTVRRSRFYNCQYYDIFMRSDERWKWPQNKNFVAENNVFGPTRGAGIEFDSISCMDSGRNPSLNPNRGVLATDVTFPTSTITLMRRAGDRYYDVGNFPAAGEIRIGKYILAYTGKSDNGTTVVLSGVHEGTHGGGAGTGRVPAGTIVTQIYNNCGGTRSDGSPNPNPPTCQAGVGTCAGFYEGRFLIRYNSFVGSRLAWGTEPDPAFYAVIAVQQYGNYAQDTQAGFCRYVADYYRYWDYNVFASQSKADTRCGARRNRTGAIGGRTFTRAESFQSCRGTGDGGRASHNGDCPPPPDAHLRKKSRAIGAGRPHAYPKTDVDGQKRPHGKIDAGADEWTPGKRKR